MKRSDPVEVRRQIGLRVREIRTAKGLTQEKARARCTVSLDQWSRVETGHAPNPTLGTLLEMAQALGVDVTEFFPQNGPEVRAPHAEEWCRFVADMDPAISLALLSSLRSLSKKKD